MIDQLIKKIKETGNPTVVGLDPTLVMIPNYLKKEMFEKYGKTPKAVAEMFVEFNRLIIDATYDLIPAVKPQIAMYEKFGLDGLDAYIRTCEYARSKGLVVIGDIKRGDMIAVLTTGAYNYSMASNYNRLGKPPVIMLRDGRDYIAVKRESLADICKNDI